MAESPFYDQGDTHVFSDWLVTSLWGYGVDDPDELYVGVFPDLSEILDRSRHQPHVHRDVWAELSRQPLRSLGLKISRAVQGRHFVDIGSGRPDKSVLPRLVAEVFGAIDYVGVDICYPETFEKRGEFSEGSNFVSRFMKNDLVTYLESRRSSGPLLLYVSGIELVSPDSSEGAAVRERFEHAIERFIGPDDFLLVGPGTTDLVLPSRVWRNVASDPYHFLLRKRRLWFF